MHDNIEQNILQTKKKKYEIEYTRVKLEIYIKEWIKSSNFEENNIIDNRRCMGKKCSFCWICNFISA